MQRYRISNDGTHTRAISRLADLVIASVLVQKRDNRLDVVLLDDVQDFRAFNQNAVQHLQNACREEVPKGKMV